MAIAVKPTGGRSLIVGHHPLGASTGYMEELRDDWPAQVAAALQVSPFAVELSALSEKQLEPLATYLAGGPNLPFRYLSVHGPSKDRRLSEGDLVARLAALSERADAIVMHPDTIEDATLYRSLGRKLAIENMDARKESGRTAEELVELFAALPDAGFCFDIAHAWSVDPEMAVADELLDRFGGRLRHLHVSSLSPELHHVPLSADDEERFRAVLERCRDVPWILEAPLRLA